MHDILIKPSGHSKSDNLLAINSVGMLMYMVVVQCNCTVPIPSIHAIWI